MINVVLRASDEWYRAITSRVTPYTSEVLFDSVIAFTRISEFMSHNISQTRRKNIVFFFSSIDYTTIINIDLIIISY